MTCAIYAGFLDRDDPKPFVVLSRHRGVIVSTCRRVYAIVASLCPSFRSVADTGGLHNGAPQQQKQRWDPEVPVRRLRGVRASRGAQRQHQEDGGDGVLSQQLEEHSVHVAGCVSVLCGCLWVSLGAVRWQLSHSDRWQQRRRGRAGAFAPSCAGALLPRIAWLPRPCVRGPVRGVCVPRDRRCRRVHPLLAAHARMPRQRAPPRNAHARTHTHTHPCPCRAHQATARASRPRAAAATARRASSARPSARCPASP